MLIYWRGRSGRASAAAVNVGAGHSTVSMTSAPLLCLRWETKSRSENQALRDGHGQTAVCLISIDKLVPTYCLVQPNLRDDVITSTKGFATREHRRI